MLHSMRETIGMNKRAIGIWWRESPGMLVELIFYVITGAVLMPGSIFRHRSLRNWQERKIRLFYAIWYCSYSESRACWD